MKITVGTSSAAFDTLIDSGDLTLINAADLGTMGYEVLFQNISDTDSFYIESLKAAATTTGIKVMPEKSAIVKVSDLANIKLIGDVADMDVRFFIS